MQKLQARGRLRSRGSRAGSDLREQLGEDLIAQGLDGWWQGQEGLIEGSPLLQDNVAPAL